MPGDYRRAVRPLVAAAAAAAVAAVLAGCGSQHARQPPPTDAEVRAQVARACRDTTGAARVRSLRALAAHAVEPTEDLVQRLASAEQELADATTPVERAIALGKRDGYAARLRTPQCDPLAHFRGAR
jgi:hypothetical protein